MNLPISKRNFQLIATRYANNVLSGKILACKWVKLACQRHFDDLERYETSGRYEFVPEQGARACRFIELLTHTKGALAGQKIRLEPWQVFILMSAFGWRRRSDGGRRYRRVYIEVPRGNGKSCLSSGIALYCLLADNEAGAEVYSFATTRDQAKIVFGDAKQMCSSNAPLRAQFGVQVLANAVYVPKTNSTFQAKSAEGSTLDGLNTHLAVIDELHAHKTRAVYDVVETSLGKRLNSLLWVITTAGFDTSGICYEVRAMVTQVLEGVTEDDTQFGIIYSIDDGDDWKSEESLIKANPNWDISVRPEMVTSLQKKAIALPSAANNFMTKHLNVWCNASSAWMNMAEWDKCTDESLSLDEFEGKPCFIGIDLASKCDMTAKVRVFPTEDSDGKLRYAIFADYYLPEMAIEKTTNSQYSGWQTMGLLHATGGAMTDISLIEEDIREDLSRFDVQAIAYDPWQAVQLAGNLSNDGAPMVEYRNTVQNVSEPMKTLEALVSDGRIRHNGDPILNWMMSNVVAKTDAKDNIYPRKERNENKIDGVVALIYALAMTLSETDDSGDFSEFVDSMIVV